MAAVHIIMGIGAYGCKRHFLISGAVRPTVRIVLVRFPYGMEDSVPSPVRDLTEIIFFLYLHSFQRL